MFYYKNILEISKVKVLIVHQVLLGCYYYWCNEVK